jgi:hypothetical protein
MRWHALQPQAQNVSLYRSWKREGLGNIPEPASVCEQCPLSTAMMSCCSASIVPWTVYAGHSLNEFNLCPDVISNAIP